MKKYALISLIFISLLTISFVSSVALHNEGTLFVRLKQSDNNYTLVITPESNKIARGDDIRIYYGVQQDINGTVSYIPNLIVNFSLFYINNTEKINFYNWNATTKSILAQYVLSFIYIKEPGDYLLNATTFINGESINATAEFKVEISPLPKINIIMPSDIYLKPNLTSTIHVQILNLGGTTARNLTISLSVLDSYPSLQLSNTLPLFVDKLEPAPNGEINAVINATILDFGYTVIQLLVSYWSIDGVNYITPFTINVYAIPSVFFSITTDNVIYKGNETKVSASLYNSENKTLNIEIQLEGENLSFSSEKLIIKIGPKQPKTVDLFVMGLVEGQTQLIINIFLIEENSEEEVHINEYKFPFFIEDAPVSEDNNNFLGFLSRPEVKYPFMFAFIFIFLGIIIISRYYGISNLIRKFLPLYLPISRYGLGKKPFSYDSKVVVVDGSNVAWEEKDEHDRPKVDNLKRIIELLSQAGFEEIIVLADASLRHQIDKTNELNHLVKMGIVKYLPAKVKGDQLLLRIAEEKNAYVLSNDLFKEFRETFEWIDERRIPFTIIQGQAYLHPTYIIHRETAKEKQSKNDKNKSSNNQSSHEHNDRNHGSKNQNKKR